MGSQGKGVTYQLPKDNVPSQKYINEDPTQSIENNEKIMDETPSSIKAKKNVRPMLPKEVWQYIDEMNFYRK